MPKHYPWPKTSSPKSAAILSRRAEGLERLPLRPKVKLHGTNASIVYPSVGERYGQSRKRALSVGDDNYGFASFVAGLDDPDGFTFDGEAVVVYGEWAGPGIQQAVAVSQIPDRTFFPFAVRLIGVVDTLVIEPALIQKWCSVLNIDCVVIPWADDAFDVPDKGWVAFAEVAKPMTDACDKSDPFILDIFGIDSFGEGFVWFPVSGSGSIPLEDFTQMFCKTKGASHQTVVRQYSAPKDDSGVQAVLDNVCTEGRAKQAVTEVSGEGGFVISSMGAYIKWACQDIIKDIEAGDVDLPEGVDTKSVLRGAGGRIASILKGFN